MKFSVVIPMYNVAAYLKTCIESVLAQSYTDIEMILVNDGSTDNSCEIAKKYVDQYQHVVLINQQNQGLSQARNTGIKAAVGDYIIFLDADDFWSKDFLGDLAKRIEEADSDAVLFRYQFYYQDQNKYEEQRYKFTREQIRNLEGKAALELILNHMTYFDWYACMLVVKRQLILSNHLFFIPDKKYEDVLWTPNVLLHAEKVDYFDEAIYSYRLEREGQITKNVTRATLTDSIYAVTYWRRMIDDQFVGTELGEKLMVNVCYRYYFALYLTGFLKNEDKKHVINLLKDNKNYLMYYTNAKQKYSYILCRLLGFNLATFIFKYYIKHFTNSKYETSQ
ncbi:glycosyltransferase [Jeotgalibacillus haloalkalitolerans]|uniref:Glycosyltransferase n=1 Tax=Jeotgalibacillus haloalkalitolerans TaxID=3104292 RepID=A0ABU5KJI2_9BACL|nr:glycosyltransferase [Jeotgalibacillus sp. HH7-29]MDZ5710911.1 glycosyltransferase [Jeotgalibacillus sp. HH7-29]